MAAHKFSTVNDKVYAIMNWKSRRNSRDVAIVKYLSPEETDAYKRHQKQGMSQTAIFGKLFPTTNRPAKGKTQIVEIDIQELSKRQISRLIETRLNETLPSLEKMNRSDLEKLLVKIQDKK